MRDGVKHQCFVVELKDGDQFDAPKSGDEIFTLAAFCTTVGSQLPCTTEIRVCSFNQNDKAAIVDGFKRAVPMSQAWTGQEFCALMGFGHEAIIQERQADAEENRHFLVQDLLQMPSIDRIVWEAR